MRGLVAFVVPTEVTSYGFSMLFGCES